MSEDTYLKVRGIAIALILLTISLILWDWQVIEMLKFMCGGVMGMFFSGILYGLYTTFVKKKA